MCRLMYLPKTPKQTHARTQYAEFRPLPEFLQKVKDDLLARHGNPPVQKQKRRSAVQGL